MKFIRELVREIKHPYAKHSGTFHVVLGITGVFNSLFKTWVAESHKIHYLAMKST